MTEESVAFTVEAGVGFRAPIAVGRSAGWSATICTRFRSAPDQIDGVIAEPSIRIVNTHDCATAARTRVLDQLDLARFAAKKHANNAARLRGPGAMDPKLCH